DQKPFTASVRGVSVPATTGRVLATSLRRPLETWVVRALITVHGVRLWRKGLPVQPRPAHPSDPSHPEVAMPDSVARRLADLIHDAVGIELPVRLRAWDGSEAGPEGGPVLVI